MAKLKKNKVIIYTKFRRVVASRGKGDVTREGTQEHLLIKLYFLNFRGVYMVFAF